MGLLGNHCNTNDDCIIVHSECKNNECACIDGFRIFGSTQCIPKKPEPKGLRKIEEFELNLTNKTGLILVGVGSPCNASRICGNGGVCVKATCICPAGTKLSRGGCIPAPIGEGFIKV